MLNGRRQPSLGRTSRVNREVYARFCERLAVRFRGPTRHLDRVRAALCKAAAVSDWGALLKVVGPPVGSRYDQRKTLPAGTTSVQMEIIVSRFALYGEAPPYSIDESDPLILAENRLLRSGQGVLCCQMRDLTVNSFLSTSFFVDYSFSNMA